MKLKEFLLKLVTSNTGVSSKRVCGILGFTVVTGLYIYATLAKVDVPDIDTYVICISALLGVDSVTDIWRDRK